jgi:short-subunit dehydrogenase involved in D-alanine esterification of teichoic acids
VFNLSGVKKSLVVPIYSATKAGVVHYSRCIAQVCYSGYFYVDDIIPE